MNKKKALALTLLSSLFLYQSVTAQPVSGTKGNKKPSFKERLKNNPAAYARFRQLLRGQGPTVISSPQETAKYQKTLKEKGAIVIKMASKENDPASTFSVEKNVRNKPPISLFEADNRRIRTIIPEDRTRQQPQISDGPANRLVAANLEGHQSSPNSQIDLNIKKQTPFTKVEQDDTGWKIYIDDGGRNKFITHVSRTGELTIISGAGKDTLEIKTLEELTFLGNIKFPEIKLEINRAENKGFIETDTLSVGRFEDLKGYFTNTGQIQIKNLRVNKCDFYNKNKLIVRDLLYLNLETDNFINDKTSEKTGVIEANTININNDDMTKKIGVFSNRGTIKVSNMQGIINTITNEGAVYTEDETEKATQLTGQTFENKASWKTNCNTKLKFQYIENKGDLTTPSLTLQTKNNNNGYIKNSKNSKIYANQIDLAGKSLTNEGTILASDRITIESKSTINEGSLSAKNLIKIDNNKNYFKNTPKGIIQTEGTLQIEATGKWWINEGEIVANTIQSNGFLFNGKSGKITSQSTTLNGDLHNDNELSTSDLNANVKSISGNGKLVMDNGQIKIGTKHHIQTGHWSCSGKCDWSAPEFSIHGKIEGKSKNGEPGQLKINSEEGEFWHTGEFYCGSGASCTTSSATKTVDTPSSQTTSDGNTKQEAKNGDLQLDGTINGKGNYAAITQSGSIETRGKIDTDGNAKLEASQDINNKKSISGKDVRLEAGQNIHHEGNVEGESVHMKAGEQLEISRTAKINSKEDTNLKAKNIQHNGKTNTGGKFTADAKQTFTNTNEINAGNGSKIKAGQKIENRKDGSIYTANGKAEIEAPEVRNKGKILSKKDLEIFASKLFLNEEDGKVAAGRDGTIRGGTVINEAGRILVGHLLRIKAKKLENKRAKPIMKKGEDCPQPPLWEATGRRSLFGWVYRLGSRTCQDDYEVESSGPGLIQSMGNIDLDIEEDATNLGSIVYAKGDITISGKEFNNLAHNLKNYKVTKSWRRWKTSSWFGLRQETHIEPTVTVRNEPTYVAATLGADGNIHVNNPTILRNTGNSKVGKSFNLGSEDSENGESKFFNGLFDSYTLTAKKPAPKTGNMEIYSYIDSLGNLFYFRISSDDEKDPNSDKKVQYILIPANDDDKKTLDQQVGAVTRGLSERPQFAYLQDKKSVSPLSYKFIMHPQLAAQILESMLITEIGTSHLSEFKDKTATEQFIELEKRGHKYARNLAECSDEDTLPLSLDQIEKANKTFVYYDLVEHEGKTGLAPVLHIGKEEAEKQVPGTEGTIEAGDIYIKTDDFKNTGTLKSTGKIKVNSHVFENRRRDYKETKIVKESEGRWRGRTRTRVFEVRKPQIGGNIIGVNIELTADKDALNEGGTILGTQSAYLISKKGNVEHKSFIGSHVVQWEIGNWDRAMGRSSADLALDYYPAKIVSGGNLEIEAEVGEVLVSASQIIAKNNMRIAGYKGVKITGEMSKHTKKRSYGLTSGEHEEEVVSQPSLITSNEGDIEIESTGGSIKVSNAIINSDRGKVHMEAKDRIDLGVEKIRYSQGKREATGGMLSIGSTDTEIVQTTVGQTAISALKGITLKAGIDNVIEAVLMHSGGYIHIVAGRDNHFKGFDKKTDVTTSGWNIGISFPGSEAIEALADGKPGDAIKSLRDGDPLLSAINRLRLAHDTADKIGESTYVAIEGLRALHQYIEMASDPESTTMGMLGKRMGLTDAKGKFAPKVTFHIGNFKSETHMSEVIKSALEAQEEIEITSDYDTSLADGTKISGKRIIIAAKNDITMSPAANELHHKSESHGTSIGVCHNGICSAGASYSKSSRDTKTNQNAKITGEEVELNAKKLKISGGEVRGKDIKVDIEKMLTVESVQDIDVGKSSSNSANIGIGNNPSSSFSYSQETIDKARVNVPSGIHATESLKINADKIQLTGGMLSGPEDNTNIRASKIKVTLVKDHEDVRSFCGTVSLDSLNFVDSDKDNDKDRSPVPTVFDVDYKKKGYSGTTYSTISPGAQIEIQQITSDLEKLNRDLDNVQVGSDYETHLRAVIPILDLKQIQEDMRRLRELLGESKKTDLEHESIEPYGQENTGDTVSEDQSPLKLKVISTESAVIKGYKTETTTIEVLDDQNVPLGEIRMGEFKRTSKTKKISTGTNDNIETSLFTKENGQRILLTRLNNGDLQIIQGDSELIDKLQNSGKLKEIGGKFKQYTDFDDQVASSNNLVTKTLDFLVPTAIAGTGEIESQTPFITIDKTKFDLFANDMITFSQGVVDSFSIGLTRAVRESNNINHGTDYSSLLYHTGENAGSIGAYYVGKMIWLLLSTTKATYSAAKAERYIPKKPLPVDKHGDPMPSSTRPHTQLGKRIGKDGKPYLQARKWGKDGKIEQDIDFSDHPKIGKKHPNPHKHTRNYRNPRDKSPERCSPEPISYEEVQNFPKKLKDMTIDIYPHFRYNPAFGGKLGLFLGFSSLSSHAFEEIDFTPIREWAEENLNPNTFANYDDQMFAKGWGKLVKEATIKKASSSTAPTYTEAETIRETLPLLMTDSEIEEMRRQAGIFSDPDRANEIREKIALAEKLRNSPVPPILYQYYNVDDIPKEYYESYYSDYDSFLKEWGRFLKHDGGIYSFYSLYIDQDQHPFFWQWLYNNREVLTYPINSFSSEDIPDGPKRIKLENFHASSEQMMDDLLEFTGRYEDLYPDESLETLPHQCLICSPRETEIKTTINSKNPHEQKSIQNPACSSSNLLMKTLDFLIPTAKADEPATKERFNTKKESKKAEKIISDANNYFIEQINNKPEILTFETRKKDFGKTAKVVKEICARIDHTNFIDSDQREFSQGWGQLVSETAKKSKKNAPQDKKPKYQK